MFHVKSVILCLAVLNWPSFGGDADSRRARTAVYVEFTAHPSGASAALRNETESILAPLGYNLEWRDAASAGHEVWADLAVVKFEGRCELDEGRFPSFVPGPLGWTEVSDGQVLPFAGIDCERIGAMLQNWLPERDRESVFQRAIGRVVAHELYHIFAGTVAHKHSGVGKPEFTALDLIAKKFRFQKSQEPPLQDSSMRAALGFSR